MRLCGVVVNQTPKFQCQEPTDLSHTISVRDEGVDNILIIHLELDGNVSCVPTFKPSQEEFNASVPSGSSQIPTAPFDHHSLE
jgi:hypothetical protein